MILAYSVALQEVADLPDQVRVLRLGELQCFYSERDRAPDPQNLKDEAVRFFEVNRALFGQADILEFRFPTLLKDLAEFEAHLVRIVPDLAHDLRRLRGHAQVTAYIPPRGASQEARSGTEYLKSKSDTASERDRLIRELSAASGARESRLDGDRIHLLVARESVQKAKAALSDHGFLSAGPFPPSSFSKLLS